MLVFLLQLLYFHTVCWFTNNTKRHRQALRGDTIFENLKKHHLFEPWYFAALFHLCFRGRTFFYRIQPNHTAVNITPRLYFVWNVPRARGLVSARFDKLSVFPWQCERRAWGGTLEWWRRNKLRHPGTAACLHGILTGILRNTTLSFPVKVIPKSHSTSRVATWIDLYKSSVKNK